MGTGRWGPIATPVSATRPADARSADSHTSIELLDDYYPAPNAAFFACDSDARIVDCGRGSFELTGLKTEQVIGRPVHDVLGLRFDDGTDHVRTALEWEVRVKSKPVEVHAERDLPAKAVADIFPAYDDEDGGVLVVLTPTNHH